MDRRWEGIEEFVAIADVGSFAGAATKLALTPSHVSRAINRLELRLGARLFERTTRSVRLTDTGRNLVERCRRLIDERDETFRSALGKDEMEGQLRITCSIALGERFIEPMLRTFQDDFPKVTLWLELTNRLVDVIGESYDIAIRTGHPGDARLTARQISARSLTVAASPAYLERIGLPRHPDELANFDCLIGTNPTWQFIDQAQRMTIVPQGRWRCNNGNSVVAAAVAGLGLCQLPDYYVRPNIVEGKLVPVLEAFRDAPEPIWAVFPSSRYRITRVRRAIAYLESRLSIEIPIRELPVEVD